MNQNRKSSYLALAMAGVLCLGTVAASVSPARARYTTAVGWQLELQQAEPEYQTVSDVLDSEGSAVRLAEMYVDEEYRDVLVNLEVTGGTATGSLSCTVSNGYLTAQCLETAREEASPRFTVRLTPTEAALELTEKTDTTIKVVWDEQLWAVFQVTLLPVDVAVFSEGTEEETTETEPALSEAVHFLSCMSGFDQKEYLAVRVIVPEYCDLLVLDLDGGEFPEFTRYSTDGGRSFTLLYDSAWIELEPAGAQAMTVLLDLEKAELYKEELTISAYAYYGDVWRGTAEAATRVLDSLPELTIGDKPIVLSEEVALILGVPQDLGGAEISYFLRRLDGSTDDIPTIAVDAENGQVYIEAVGENHRAKAGTYLLDMNWTYQGAVAASRQLVFYVNYSTCIQETQGTAAEQVTDQNQSSDPTQATTTGGSES